MRSWGRGGPFDSRRLFGEVALQVARRTEAATLLISRKA